MNTEEAATVLQIASTLDESEDKNLMTVATILRGMLGEIQRLCTESDKLRADLAARDAEIADLKRGGVVAPDGVPEEVLDLIAADTRFRWYSWDEEHDMAVKLYHEWLLKHARPIPADRVLGEGDVKVSAKAIEQASKTLDSLVVTSWARGDHEEKMVTELCAAFRSIACAATCAQPTQEPTP